MKQDWRFLTRKQTVEQLAHEIDYFLFTPIQENNISDFGKEFPILHKIFDLKFIKTSDIFGIQNLIDIKLDDRNITQKEFLLCLEQMRNVLNMFDSRKKVRIIYYLKGESI